jgi:hypothetical protein
VDLLYIDGYTEAPEILVITIIESKKRQLKLKTTTERIKGLSPELSVKIGPPQKVGVIGTNLPNSPDSANFPNHLSHSHGSTT